LFRVIDWMMALPEELARNFNRSVEEFEEERKMPYVTSIERHGIEKGLQQGLQQGREQGLHEGRLQALREVVLEILEDRFQGVPGAVRADVTAVEDAALLKELRRRAVSAASVEEFELALTGPNERPPAG
jgi:predicted transposase YdaD